MNITDEQLSAFLDAELSDTEMELIREQLIEDEDLANRLAELAIVDELVVKAYSTIDAQALPASITQLLSKEPPDTAQIIELPLWKKIQRSVTQHAAMAASVMLVIGFGVIQTLNNTTDHWQSVAQALETQPSGIEQIMGDMRVKSRLTFIDKNGHYCRQFELIESDKASANIACRQNNEWQLIASINLDKIQETSSYQTATENSAMNELIDEMAVGDFFDAQAEALVINTHWSK